MTDFMDFILQLFVSNGYEMIPQPDHNKPMFLKNNKHDDYWLVAESLDSYRHQAGQYEWFSKDLGKRFPLAEKNTSLLLLVDKDRQQGDFDEVEIENDQLYFKKYVLPYTEDGLHALKEEIAKSQNKTFDDLIMNNDTFEAVRNGDGYATLLYTIVHKLPFIPINAVSHQAEQQVFAFSTPAIAELFDTLKDLPAELSDNDVDGFINNYLNADNNEEH